MHSVGDDLPKMGFCISGGSFVEIHRYVYKGEAFSLVRFCFVLFCFQEKYVFFKIYFSM